MEDYRKQVLYAIIIVWSVMILFMIEQGHYMPALGLAALGGLILLLIYPSDHTSHRDPSN